MSNHTGEVTLCVNMNEFDKAPVGYVAVKAEGGRIRFVSPDTFVKEYTRKVAACVEKTQQFDALKKHVKHFKVRCKSHFVNAFCLFKLKVITGEIGIENQDAFTLDQQVLSNGLSIRDALSKDENLMRIFVAIYGDVDDEDESEGDTKTFPEV